VVGLKKSEQLRKQQNFMVIESDNLPELKQDYRQIFLPIILGIVLFYLTSIMDRGLFEFLSVGLIIFQALVLCLSVDSLLSWKQIARSTEIKGQVICPKGYVYQRWMSQMAMLGIFFFFLFMLLAQNYFLCASLGCFLMSFNFRLQIIKLRKK